MQGCNHRPDVIGGFLTRCFPVWKRSRRPKSP